MPQTPQTLRPSSTISTGPGGGSQWQPYDGGGAGGTCHEALSDQSDVTWVQGTDPTSNILKMGLSAALSPGAGARIITVRAAADQLNLGFTDSGKVNVEIRDADGVLIEALQTATIIDDQTIRDYELTVVAPIEDYSTLQLWITGDAGWTIGLDIGLFDVYFTIPAVAEPEPAPPPAPSLAPHPLRGERSRDSRSGNRRR